jgi:hypothetical protein
MNNFEKPIEKFELEPNEKVSVVALLDDPGGARYFLKSESGKYFYLDQSLTHCEEVDEAGVASAIIKHGYKPVAEGETFVFKDRLEMLKSKKDE